MKQILDCTADIIIQFCIDMKRIFILIAIIALASCQKEAIQPPSKARAFREMSAAPPPSFDSWTKICGTVISKFEDADGYLWAVVDYQGTQQTWPVLYFIYPKLRPGTGHCIWVRQ